VPSPSVDGSYAGEITVKEAWEWMNDNPDAQMIDVRTDAEWGWVGIPDLTSTGKQLHLIQWITHPSNDKNPYFSEQVEHLNIDKKAPILFLCRSGKRSLFAARLMQSLGYTACYNITEGFEGNPNEQKHRSTVNGWKFENLPWLQG